MLERNGFTLARRSSHDIWVFREGASVTRRVPVSHGNAEIRTRGHFSRMLRQAGKTEEHFYEVLRG